MLLVVQIGQQVGVAMGAELIIVFPLSMMPVQILLVLPPTLQAAINLANGVFLTEVLLPEPVAVVFVLLLLR